MNGAWCCGSAASAPPGIPASGFRSFISQSVFVGLFFKSQLPHKSVNLAFIITDMKNELTDLCGS